MNVCLYMSTDPYDPVSALIRLKTECGWSHVGFYDLDKNLTFSAMNDGLGVAWRPLKEHQKILLLDCDFINEIFQEALKQEGKRYDQLDIVGLATGLNLHQEGCLICDVLVFKAAQDSKHPLLGMWAIPLYHLTPRDILLSPSVRLRP